MDRIIIEKIPENLGGGFTAYNESMRYACIGDGETEVEALNDFLTSWEERHLTAPPSNSPKGT